jgi:hypothetical protein
MRNEVLRISKEALSKKIELSRIHFLQWDSSTDAWFFAVKGKNL